MFNVGDEVRLNAGWTRMVVIGFQNNGIMIAKYDSEGYHIDRRVKDSDFKNPQFASGTKKRYPNEFTKWDGAPATKVFYTMSKFYRVLTGPHSGERAEYRSTTSSGKLILELPTGDVITCNASNAEEIVPVTFMVKAVGSNYRCAYVAPVGSVINKGDMLLSDSGNVYCVMGTNTKDRSTKSIFSGVRILTESL